MLDIAWPELIVIGAVALVAVGPKDLPRVMHALGRLAGRARAVMHDLHVALDQVSAEAERAAKTEQEKKTETPAETSETDRERNA